MNPTSHGINHNFVPEKAAIVFVLQHWNYRLLLKIGLTTLVRLFIDIVILSFPPLCYFFWLFSVSGSLYLIYSLLK